MTAAWDRALLGALEDLWGSENSWRFRERLRRPGLRLDDATHRFAAWVLATREIVVSRRLVADQPWGVVREVILHEMAHQYAHEVLGAVQEAAHGPAFREVCARFGVDAAATGLPRAEEVATPKIVERVRKLLALAESPNEHEAQAAMNAAQALLLRHNLAEALRNPAYVSRDLPPVRARLHASDRWVSLLLRDHFFVRAIFVRGFDAGSGRTGQWLEVSGTAENVELAAWVNQFLRDTGSRLYTARRPRPRGGELAFLAGLVRGFVEKLRAQSKKHEEEGLVWVGDPGLERYEARRYPALRRLRGGSARASEAWSAGREAGEKLVLHRPVSAGPSGGGGLLGG